MTTPTEAIPTQSQMPEGQLPIEITPEHLHALGGVGVGEAFSESDAQLFGDAGIVPEGPDSTAAVSVNGEIRIVNSDATDTNNFGVAYTHSALQEKFGPNATDGSDVGEATVKPVESFTLTHVEQTELFSGLRGLSGSEPINPGAPHDEAVAVSRDGLVRADIDRVLSDTSRTDGSRILSLARDMGAATSRSVSIAARGNLHDLIRTTKSVAPELANAFLESFIDTQGHKNGVVNAENAAATLNKILDTFEGVEGGKKAQGIILAIAYGASFKTGDGRLRRTAQDGLASLLHPKE